MVYDKSLSLQKMLEFYSAEWIKIGTKTNLSNSVSSFTGISIDVLEGKDLKNLQRCTQDVMGI
jgi:hypothetical protein